MRPLAALAAVLMLAGLSLPNPGGGSSLEFWILVPPYAFGGALAGAVILALAAGPLGHRRWAGVLLLAGLALGASAPLFLVCAKPGLGLACPGLWIYLAGLTLVAWGAIEFLAGLDVVRWGSGLAAPILFGVWMLYLWEVGVVGFGVPQVLLPAPHQIGFQLVHQASILWGDFRQTFLRAVLAGWAAGCGLGFLVAMAIDRIPFLQRGLLPLSNLASAVPIVGIAPIMVMWFGFDWQSKAAVVVVMTFFPMLVNVIAGLAASDSMSRDLMRSYGAGYWQAFLKLRLPAALPFVFNGLKINSTLALIGAIVAEFFGSPISGMGFRISVEVARMNVDVVWATIAVAALAGSLFYLLIAMVERGLTFWHPSYRRASR